MTGTIMHIDMNTGTGSVRHDPELFAAFLGGTAVATELLFRHGNPQGDPLAPESPIIFTIGPFSSLFPVATKTVAMFKSPLSGELGESHAGGRMAMSLREAGLDALVITGRAERPSYLVIENEQAIIKSASTFHGQSSAATERILREAEGKSGRKVSILRIGPAGERLSPMACATVDGSRHFGRLGLGAVLGSKNLKAIVVSGTKTLPLARPKEFKAVYDTLYDRVVKSKEMKKYHDLGTPANIRPLSMIRGLPTRNFSQGNFEGADAISGERFAKDFLVQHTSCAHCQCGCIHMAELREEFAPYHYSTNRISYDYELIYAMGSMLSLSSPEEILKLLLFTEKQGWDAISLGCTLAWATEAFLRGTLSLDDTEGLPLSFGDCGSYLSVLERMAKGEGEFFRDLEKGCAWCANKRGGTEWAIQYGGVEPGGYLTGENFTVTCLLGIRHSHLDDNGYSIDQNLLNASKPLEEQVRAQVKEARWRMVLNSLVVCLFARGVYDAEVILQGLDALGEQWNEARLRDLAAQALKRKHEWKRLCGFDPAEVAVPEKIYSVQTSNGMIDRERLAERLRLYREEAGI
jgi:aldehyde:ferredoxin oxidoreductase